MTSISKKVYIDKLDDIVNKYNNTYHITIKMKPVDVNPNIYIDFNKENNNRGRKFNVGLNVKISEYQNIFAKGYVPNQSAEEFIIKKKSKILCPQHMLLVILTERLERFMKKSCKKQIKKSLE